jgi:hypothetical protein
VREVKDLREAREREVTKNMRERERERERERDEI